MSNRAHVETQNTNSLTLVLLLCWLLIISCHSRNNLLEASPEFPAFSDSEITQKMILSIKVKEITEHDSFDDSTIGFGSTVSPQFSRYKWLLKNATTEDLIELTDHNSTVVKAYAIQALYARHYQELKKIFSRQFKDSSTFLERSGCIGFSKKYNSFFFQLIKNELSDSENIKYKKYFPESVYELAF